MPSESAYSTDAPEMELIAFHPVVLTMEKRTTNKLPQYPNEKREKVVIRRPVNPNVAVQAGKRQEKMFTVVMMAKQCQKLRPMLPPTIPVFNVATAKLALILSLC